MSPKVTLALLVVVLALGAAFYFLKSPSDYTPVREITVSLELPAFKPEAVERLRIQKGLVEVDLTKSDKDWVVANFHNYPAKSADIVELIKQVARIRGPEIRAESSSSHARFGVDSGDGWQLELSGSGDALPYRVVVGKAADAPDHCYARGPEADEVYAVSPNVVQSGRLSWGKETLGSWCKTRLYQLDQETEVERITIHQNGETIALVSTPGETAADPKEPTTQPEVPEKPERTWRVTAPEEFEPDASAVTALVSRYRFLEVAAPVDPNKVSEYGLTPPARWSEIKPVDESAVRVEIGKEVPEGVEGYDENRKRFYLRLAGSDRVYVAGEYTCDGFFKTLDELKPAEPESPADPETPDAVPAIPIKPIPGSEPEVPLPTYSPPKPKEPEAVTQPEPGDKGEAYGPELSTQPATQPSSQPASQPDQ